LSIIIFLFSLTTALMRFYPEKDILPHKKIVVLL